MLSEIQQIVTSYEQLGMSPAQISEDRSIDEVSVKVALAQNSAKYRKDCGKENDEESNLNFSNEQLIRINEKLFEIALSAEHSDGSPDYRTQATVAMYIRDDKKGRKEVIQTLNNGNTFNILQINQQLQQARKLADKEKKLIEV